MPTKTYLNLPDYKRLRLEEAARAEFARTPYGKVSINRILHAASIPRGSFYMYFTDKGDLFAHLLSQSGEEMLDRLARWLPRESTDPFAVFLALFDAGLYRGGEGPAPWLCQVLQANAGLNFSGIVMQGNREKLRPFMAQFLPLLGSRLDEEDSGDLMSMLFNLTGSAVCAVYSGQCSQPEARRQLENQFRLLRVGLDHLPESPHSPAAML